MEEFFKIKDMNREWTTLKEYEDILFEFYNGIARITINRPQVRNAFTPRTVSEMSDAFYICRERCDVRVVVLTGAGDKAFCSGGDMHVKGHGGYVGDDGVPRLNVLEVQKQIRSLPKPVIAAVNGFALGGGCELSMACDIRICADTAVFGQPETGLGITPGFSGTQRLPRRVGIAKAKELIFSGKVIGAAEAEKIGLVNAVYAPEELIPGAIAMAKSFTANAPIAVKYSKACIDRGMQMDIDDGIALENELFAMCFATADQKEGMGAFLEKRKEKHFQNK